MVDRKCKRPAGNDGRKPVGAFPEPGEALRKSLAAEAREDHAADEAAARKGRASVHWQTP